MLLPSNSVGNYNDQPKNISNERSTVDSSLITDPHSLLANAPTGHVDTGVSLLEGLLRLSLLNAPAGHSNHSLQSFFPKYFCFGCFSQSVAYIATRFGECSSTLLDKLWYLYSYIYHRVSSNTYHNINNSDIIISCCCYIDATYHTFFNIIHC